MPPNQISPEALKAVTDRANVTQVTRLAWMTLYRDSNSAALVCRTYHISRKTFYKWLGRFRASDEKPSSLKDRSRRPKTFPRATPQETVTFIVQIRQRTGYGQRRIKAYLLKNHGIELSERTIWKILKQQGLVP